MAQRSIGSTRIGWALMAAFFAVQAYQAATRPISPQEAYTYDRFVRPPMREVLAHELPNSDVLYSLLEKRSIGLLHVSPFAVRLPNLLFGLLFLWSVGRLVGWRGVVVAAAGAIFWGGFTVANGVGAAIALGAFAVQSATRYVMSKEPDQLYNLNFCGISLGLAIAARQEFAAPAAAIALVLLFLIGRRQACANWTERVVIPAVVTTLVMLVLPLTHAHAASEVIPGVTREAEDRLHSAIEALHAAAGNGPVTIGASGEVQPVINFYRAQHRLNGWNRAEGSFHGQPFQFYLLDAADWNRAERSELAEIYRNSGFVIARRIP